MACSAEPSKKVCSMCRMAERLALSRAMVGRIDVARPVLLVPDVAFFLENSQHGAHGRVARGIGQRRLNLGRGAPALGIKDVDNLPFAPAELVMRRRLHKCQFVVHNP